MSKRQPQHHPDPHRDRSPHALRVRAQRRAWLEQRAHEMRRAPTPSEARLWLALKSKRLGFTFRRQVVVGGQYIADFLARDVRLIVELDGPCHGVAADARRDRDLGRLGYRTLRFPATAVDQDLVSVVRRILEELHGVKLD